MLALATPKAAYRRVERDAAILGSDARALSLYCFDELETSLASALHANRTGAYARRGTALSGAIGAISALRTGTDPGHALAAAMHALFDAADRSLRASMVDFRPLSLEAIRQDFTEIRLAMFGARQI